MLIFGVFVHELKAKTGQATMTQLRMARQPTCLPFSLGRMMFDLAKIESAMCRISRKVSDSY
jgi:hypothetical protein